MLELSEVWRQHGFLGKHVVRHVTYYLGMREKMQKREAEKLVEGLRVQMLGSSLSDPIKGPLHVYTRQ